MLAKKSISVLIFFSMLLATMVVFFPGVQAHTESDPFVTDLIAGGGNPASAMNVGNVSVWNDADYIYVQFNTKENCYLVETHLAVSTELSGIPQTKKGNPIPGQFEYSNESHDPFERSYTYMMPLELDPGEDICIAAHAVVCCTTWTLGSELVTNGDFESPVVTAPQGWDIYDSGTVGMGWSVEWYDGSTSYGGQERPSPAHLELHRGVNGWLPNTGDQHAELDTDWDGPGGGLNNEPASVNISQVIPTGDYCQVNFSWSPRPGHSDNQMEVYWEDGLLYGLSAPGNGNTEWIDESVILLSSEDMSKLAFVEKGTPDSLGMFLDSVSVKCFPCETAWGDGEDFDGANWATYFCYEIQAHQVVWPESGTVTFAYEDLPIGGGNDYDYNDFVVSANIVANYTYEGMKNITFAFEARARGASYHHAFLVQIPAFTFDSDGSFKTEYYTNTGVKLSEVSGVFDSDSNFVQNLFGDTWNAIAPNPGQSWSANTFDGSGTQTGRVTVLTIEFDENEPFDLSIYTPAYVGVHGSGLFFNPALYVKNTGQTIGQGDARMIVVPVDWEWPQETAPIWLVYPYNGVTMEGVTSGNPPTFTTYWYTETPTALKWTP